MEILVFHVEYKLGLFIIKYLYWGSGSTSHRYIDISVLIKFIDVGIWGPFQTVERKFSFLMNS